jgi:hypothetical protein
MSPPRDLQGSHLDSTIRLTGVYPDSNGIPAPQKPVGKASRLTLSAEVRETILAINFSEKDLNLDRPSKPKR